jgi:uncharacterized membrane protein YhaH (DUF805 family)
MSPLHCELKIAAALTEIANMDLLSLFFSFRGKVRRGDFWYASLVVLSVLAIFDVGAGRFLERSIPLLICVPIVWSLFALCIKRYHDIGRSGWWMALLAIPILGPAWVFFGRLSER